MTPKHPMHSAAILLSLTALLAATAVAERAETITLYQGTPDSVHWGLDKSGFNLNLQGDIAFTVAGQPVVPHNTFGLSFSRPTWEIPPFDNKGGNRTLTGISVRLAGSLDATFRGSAAGRKRNIEGVFKHARIEAEIRKPGLEWWDTAPVLYSYEAGDGNNIEALPNPQPELVWDVTTTVDEEGKIDRGSNAATIASGGSRISLGGYLFWMPFYKLNGAYVDCGTNAWEIPGETSTTSKAGYPIDELGRNIKEVYGTPQYPIYNGPMNQSPYLRKNIYGRTGTATPMTLQVIYYYQDAGDTDFGKDPYETAGAYKAPFEVMDTKLTQSSSKDYPDAYAIQGNRFLEMGEWLQSANDYENTKKAHGGITLLWQGDGNGHLIDNANKDARRLFYWTDADGDEKISPQEYVLWRELIKASLLRKIDPFTLFPKTDEEFKTRVSPETILAEVVKIKIPEEPADPKTPAGAVFLIIDKNNDGLLSQTEWNLFFYAKPPTKETAFGIADSDKNKRLTFAEFEKAAKVKGSSELIKGKVARAAAFLQLDQNGNRKVSRLEIGQMWIPGTPAKKIDSVWKRIGGKDFSLNAWLKAKTLPSLASYTTARSIRKNRGKVFIELDKNKDGSLTLREYSHLFPHKTKRVDIESSWQAATGLPDKGKKQTSMSKKAFVEALKLPKLRIY